MRATVYAIFALLIAALYVYFLGTPLVAKLTGFSLRAVSLTAGIAIVGFGLAAVIVSRRVSGQTERK